MDTSGFYKLDGDLLYGTYVAGPGYELVDVNHDQYAYPVEGWYWFTDDISARTFFNIPEPVDI